jgi:hypothetical protein
MSPTTLTEWNESYLTRVEGFNRHILIELLPFPAHFLMHVPSILIHTGKFGDAEQGNHKVHSKNQTTEHPPIT